MLAGSAMTNLQVAEHLYLLAQSLVTDAAALEKVAALETQNAADLDIGERIQAKMRAIDHFGRAIGRRAAVEAILALAKEVLEE
jgi:hypothetical protein